jgi:hypothetical protein
MKTYTPFASIKAAIAAARRLANRTRKPVTIIVPGGAGGGVVRERLPTMPTLRIPREPMQKVVARKLNPRRRRRPNPLGLDKRPDYISPRDWKRLAVYEAQARRLRRYEAGAPRLASGGLRRSPTAAYQKIRDLGDAYLRRYRVRGKNPTYPDLIKARDRLLRVIDDPKTSEKTARAAVRKWRGLDRAMVRQGRVWEKRIRSRSKNPRASKVLRGFTMDYTADVEYAQSPDGGWFSRVKGRGPYGYKWSRWKPAAEPDLQRFTPSSARRTLPKRNPGRKKIRRSSKTNPTVKQLQEADDRYERAKRGGSRIRVWKASGIYQALQRRKRAAGIPTPKMEVWSIGPPRKKNPRRKRRKKSRRR